MEEKQETLFAYSSIIGLINSKEWLLGFVQWRQCHVCGGGWLWCVFGMLMVVYVKRREKKEIFK